MAIFLSNAKKIITGSAILCLLLSLSLIYKFQSYATYENKYVTDKSDKYLRINSTHLKPEWAELLKCQTIRLNRLHERCQALGLAPKKSLHELDERQLKQFGSEFYIDDRHHVTLKALLKTGCTSWKTMLFNNTLYHMPWRNSLPWVHSREKVNEELGLYTIRNYNKEAILSRLNSYLNILTVRHPLARMESGFKDKLLHWKGKKEGFNSSLTPDVLKMFVNFLQDLKSDDVDRHFDSYLNKGFPCMIPFNYIGKTETANIEMMYLIHEKLSKVGGPIEKNKTIKTDEKSINSRELYLHLFSMLKNPQKEIEELMKFYSADMALFGYEYKIRDDGVYATCESYDFNGMCC